MARASNLVITHNVRSSDGWLCRQLSSLEHPVQHLPTLPDRYPAGFSIPLAAQEPTQSGHPPEEVPYRPSLRMTTAHSPDTPTPHSSPGSAPAPRGAALLTHLLQLQQPHRHHRQQARQRLQAFAGLQLPSFSPGTPSSTPCAIPPFANHNASKERCLYRPSSGGYTTSRGGPKMLDSHSWSRALGLVNCSNI